jgi:ABC-type oligopeptide transport system substrate-binding subunit
VSRAFERGDVDLVRLAGLGGSSGPLEAQGVGLARGSGHRGTVPLFNLRRPPFHDARLRRAVASALDLLRISRAFAGTGNPIEPPSRGVVHSAGRDVAAVAAPVSARPARMRR